MRTQNSWKLSLILFSFIMTACGGGKNNGGNEEENKGLCTIPKTKSSSLKALFDCNGNKLKDTDGKSNKVSWETPSFFKEEDKWLNGIGYFRGCTASLIDPGEDSDSSPAYLITNGHCIRYLGGFLPSDKYILDESYQSEIIFDQYYDVTDESLRPEYPTSILRYGSMHGTDIAIVELAGVSLGDLKKQGITAYKLAKNLPTKGSKIETIGIPGAFVSEVVLRHSICHMGGEVNVKEGPFEFEESYELKCNVLPGSSGSPVFNFKTKEIISLINTTVNDGTENQEPCTLNRPCERKNGEITVDPLTNYMQPTTFLHSCFTAQGVFDRTLENCKLK